MVLASTSPSLYAQARLSIEQADKLIVEKPEAAYPPLARQMRLQGAVKADVTISESGTVSSTKLISGHPLLVTAALDAVKKYRYKPYLIDGRAVPFITTVEVPFSVGIPKKDYDEQQSVNERYFKEADKCRALLKDKKSVEAEEVCKEALPIADQLPDSQGESGTDAFSALLSATKHRALAKKCVRPYSP